MRTVIIIVMGLGLLAALISLGRFTNHALWGRKAALLFISFWLIFTGWNMYIGVHDAGYSIMEELPFFVANFGLPAGVAVFMGLKQGGRG